MSKCSPGGAGKRTVATKIKQVWQLPWWRTGMARVGQPSAGISQFIKEGLDHSINGRQSLCGCVLQKSRNEVDGVVGRFAEHLDIISWWLRTRTLETYFVEWMWFDL